MQKNGIWGKYFYVNHTFFILYLEGNHTLLGEKLYFIWNLSSGNTGSSSTLNVGTLSIDCSIDCFTLHVAG